MAQDMKVYSWNMLFYNSELDRAFKFIAESDFDIFCLQEVPEEFLDRLKTLSCFMTFNVESELVFSNRKIKTYIVILSKYPIVNSSRIPFPEYEWSLLPLRTRIFVRLMRPFRFSKICNRAGLYSDIKKEDELIRVFNLHLILAKPEWRSNEFEIAMSKYDNLLPTIICGDFNILERPHITTLNWILGGKISDFIHYKRERIHIEKLFVKYKLQNTLSKKITHLISFSQLDHILLSQAFSVLKVEVIPSRFGSDHNPILAELI